MPHPALICLGKGILAGLAAGAVYTALARSNKTSAKVTGTVVAAIVCPVVNTGIFVLGLAGCFQDILVSWAGGSSVVYYVLVVLVGLNFLMEMLINIVLSPVIVRIIQAKAHM